MVTPSLVYKGQHSHMSCTELTTVSSLRTWILGCSHGRIWSRHVPREVDHRPSLTRSFCPCWGIRPGLSDWMHLSLQEESALGAPEGASPFMSASGLHVPALSLSCCRGLHFRLRSSWARSSRSLGTERRGPPLFPAPPLSPAHLLVSLSSSQALCWAWTPTPAPWCVLGWRDQGPRLFAEHVLAGHSWPCPLADPSLNSQSPGTSRADGSFRQEAGGTLSEGEGGAGAHLPASVLRFA